MKTFLKSGTSFGHGRQHLVGANVVNRQGGQAAKLVEALKLKDKLI